MKAPDGLQWVNFNGIGKQGLNVFDDASLINDLQLTEAENITYDGGLISPIKGSTLLFSRPDGETGEPLQLITPKTSDGVEYIVVVYANHFYLWHDENEELIRINNSYVPVETDLPYGNVNWNNGRGDDRLYGCNGVDNFFRWDICVTTSSGTNTSGASSFTVTDGTRFPNTGTLVIKGSGASFTEAYTSRSGNVFTLTNTLNETVPAGSSVTIDMVEKSGMEVGKIVGKYQQRLISCNYYGGETTGWYSVQTNPESFTTGTNVEDASTFVISDGNGEITGFHDFGAFAVIEKSDSIHRLEIIIDETLGSKLDKITPILSGESLGPISQLSTLKILNTLYYPTTTNGFISLYPAGTGSDTSVNYKTLSQPIDPLLDTLNLVTSRAAATSNKAFWAVSIKDGNQNTKVLIYDALRDVWSIRTGWAVKDFTVKDDVLHYLDSSNGRVFECLNEGYHDNSNPYQVNFATKRFDFGVMSEPKTGDLVYVQGYMTPATKLYLDVLFNEGGNLGTQTFLISKDTERLQFSAPLTNALGEFILGTVPMGWAALQEIGELIFFRAYLGINPGNGWFNIQIRGRHNVGTFFGITGIAFLPRKEAVIPADMVISPVD